MVDPDRHRLRIGGLQGRGRFGSRREPVLSVPRAAGRGRNAPGLARQRRDRRPRDVVVGEGQHRRRRRSGRARGPCRRSAGRRPPASPPTAACDRQRPVADLARPGRRGQDRGADRAGSSLRGLSSVTMTPSASRAAMSPIIGRLPGSRSPPQPNTTTRRRRTKGRKRLERLFERVGLVGIVDEDRRAMRRADEVEPPLGALEVTERGEDAVRIAARRDGEPGGHEGVLDLEPPGERQQHHADRARNARASGAARSLRRRAVTSLIAWPFSPTVVTARPRRADAAAKAAASSWSASITAPAPGGSSSREQAKLGVAIGLDARVIVEMVARRDW